jgi:WS/DGAT/MGAT family acyltransferase
VRRLSGADSQFLRRETLTEHQHTIKVTVLDPSTAYAPVTYDALRDKIRDVVPMLPPFRWRLVEPPLQLGLPWWADDTDLDVDYHVRRMAAPSPGGPRELSEVISIIASTGLARDRPLWQMWFVEGIADERVAIVIKVHHSLADGMASAKLLADIMTTSAGSSPFPPADRAEPESIPSRAQLLRDGVVEQARLLWALPALVRRTVRSIRYNFGRRRSDEAYHARAFDAPKVRFNEPLTPYRSFAYVTLDLTAMKQVKNALGGTLNDVFLALCSGAVRRYLAGRDELPDTTLTATVPVSIRRPEENDDYGNRVNSWFVRLRTELSDPVARYRAIHRETTLAKEIHAERDTELMWDWQAYWAPFRLVTIDLLGLGQRFQPESAAYTLVAANVPGPREPLYSHGAGLEELISVGPLLKGMGLNFTGWSYVDRLTIGVLVCPERVPDVWTLAEGLEASLDELVTRADRGADPGDDG